ncbi:unnamed protein product [Rotaria sp. Silwood1]|nr:unnamed protein product [Rotaria sp. Silwood1]
MSKRVDDGDDETWKPYDSSPLDSVSLSQESYSATSNMISSTNASSSSKSAEENQPTEIKVIILNLKIKYDHSYIREFVKELTRPDDNMIVNNRKLSILQLYTLHILNDSIDTSNQTICKIYRPTLFTRKNDAFGPFNHYFLLNLFDIEYECPNGDVFPKLWRTTNDTNVIVREFQMGSMSNGNITSITEVNANDNDTTTLYGILRTICRENKYDERDANKWIAALRDENINTIDHLRSITKDDWDKLNRISHVVKQLIRDYMQINSAVASFNQNTDPYKESIATLIGDIHRIRRYFYYTIKKLHLIPYLSRKAVDSAIDEVRKTYDDDGNILINIHNYLRTFCLENKIEDKALYEQKTIRWATEIEQLRRELPTLELNIQQSDRRRVTALRNIEVSKNRRDKIYENAQKVYEKENELYMSLVTKAANNKKQIESLEKLAKFKLDDQQKKLSVKYGRGLLLYGPPGTGKSELLKRVAIYAGITMITQPLAAGELNRPYVGETEKLLVDIMYRAHTIPFLICAMTIDEIDGLVPKRDNNAQQGKVDGISVLLSHIEGVKNIPNLIVFGATNRRNMMDEAFLRRMQAKVFVGRPSPAIRSNMLLPLVCKDSSVFTPKRIDSLVKITTNFSGAAIGALKSNLIIEMDRNPKITDHRLLELADSVAREFNIWFGISTLPEICRLNPTIINSTQHEDNYSLEFEKLKPTGRILIDYTDRKCLIEIKDEPTLEKDLESDETSVPRLLARFIHGCSTRNIDTIQTIDLNFLIKQNAFDENQIFELLTTTFLECNEYNRSMLIFDIDSLIMLNRSDSEMSTSKSISNIRVYQFIREKCKTSIVEETEPNEKGVVTKIEKWIVMIVKDPWLKNTLVDDIEFRKSSAQVLIDDIDEKKRIDEETPRKCPKCLRNYTPKDARDGSCYYHPGFVVDIDHPNEQLTGEKAQAILQCVLLQKLPEQEIPKLIWACCLRRYGESIQPCEIGKCGLPKELEGTVQMNNDDYINMVQEHFKKSPTARKNLDEFLRRYRQTTTKKGPTGTSVQSSTERK